jgi:spoIIIJ-associated protein
MKSIELTGKTLQEVKAQAAAELGVPEDQVELEIIEEKRGLLGLLGGALTARASVRQPQAVETAATEGESESTAEALAPSEPESEIAHEDAELARLANRAEEVAHEVLRLMGVDVTARAAEIGEEEVRVELTGADIALVIGKHGDTLDALQLLVAIIANRQSEASARVVLDAEGYRDRRRRSLEATALAHAARARQTRREVVIRDLKAYERRVVHLVLRDDPGVETYSEGEGRHRNLVISPLPQGEDESAGQTEAGDATPGSG